MSCDQGQVKAAQAATASGITRPISRAAALAAQTKLGVPPEVKIDRNTERYGRYTVSPLPVGFGVTVGSALRRMLLGGTQGAAVTSVKVDGIRHEFSTLPEVREDMTALILNLKQLRFRFKQDKPARIGLKLRGEGPVTGADLYLPPHVEVVNPDQVILTGATSAASLDLAFSAETGYGYSPSEARAQLLPDEIAVDAVFSPIQRANFQVLRASVPEIARSGQPFEKLVVEVRTDGTLSAEASVRQVASTLSGQFDLIATAPWSRHVQEPAIPYRRSLESLGLRPRSLSRLQEAGLEDVNSLMKVVRQGKLADVAGLGKVSARDVLDRLAAQNLAEEDQLVLKALRKGKQVRS